MKRFLFLSASALCVLASGAAAAAPASATVTWTMVGKTKPVPGWTTTVTEFAIGPPVWRYTIASNATGPRFDRVVIDLDVPCDAPKGSGAPTVTPKKGPSQHYVMAFGVPGKTQTITIPCDARRGGNADFEMLGFLLATKKLLARSSVATVDGPK